MPVVHLRVVAPAEPLGTCRMPASQCTLLPATEGCCTSSQGLRVRGGIPCAAGCMWPPCASLLRQGYSLLAFRPHAGEAGGLEHLHAAFLTARGINHGINLRRTPSLQYLYYLAQVRPSPSPVAPSACTSHMCTLQCPCTCTCAWTCACLHTLHGYAHACNCNTHIYVCPTCVCHAGGPGMCMHCRWVWHVCAVCPSCCIAGGSGALAPLEQRPLPHPGQEPLLRVLRGRPQRPQPPSQGA